MLAVSPVYVLVWGDGTCAWYMTSVDWHSPLSGWLDPAVTRLNGRPWLELRSVVTFNDGGYVSHAAVADFYLVFVEDLIQCRTLWKMLFDEAQEPCTNVGSDRCAIGRVKPNHISATPLPSFPLFRFVTVCHGSWMSACCQGVLIYGLGIIKDSPLFYIFTQGLRPSLFGIRCYFPTWPPLFMQQFVHIFTTV